MGDLISREGTLAEIKRIYCTGCNDYRGTKCRACEISDAMDVVEDMPAVDAEPVVYCRDCVLWKPVDKNTGKCPFLIGEHQYTGAEHYCSCGERAQEEG